MHSNSHGRYRMIRRIAQGGMAEVYVAEYCGDANFVRTLAVKRILPQWLRDPQYVKMIQDEANLLVQLQHRNIVQVFELFQDDAALCISMEYVDGVDLRQLLSKLHQNNERIEPPLAYWIISEVLNALTFAHSRLSGDGYPMGIVHRDISPQNILLAWHGEVKVADFGIAKGHHRSDETHAGQLKGKFAYMSPEQARGDIVDSRSDIFSTGTVLFEMLTGHKLFDGNSDTDVLRRVQNVVMPSGWERNVAPEMRVILRKALKKHADERYQSAEEMRRDISRYVANHQCQIFGVELSPYLRTVFSNQVRLMAEQGSCSDAIIAVTNVERVLIKGCKYWTALAVGLLLATLSAVHSPAITEKKIVMPAENLPLPVVPVPTEVKEERKLQPESGKLSVQVRPWGYVTIPGVVSRRESPLSLSLNEGEYKVKIFYEPARQWLNASITIKSGSNTRCLASFGSQPKITCK